MHALTKLSSLITTPALVLALATPALAEAAEAAETAEAPAATATPAAAEAPQASSFHADAEIDPTAYILKGYSLHVGMGGDHFRVDLGAFAMAVPTFMHGNKALDVSFDGFGVKFEYFPFAEYTGAFVGVGTGMMNTLVRLKGSDLAKRQTHVSAGAHIGYRIDIYKGFYATPWVGVDYTFDAKDVTLGGETYKGESVSFFPAVHLGYRFR